MTATKLSTQLEKISRFEYPGWLMRFPKLIYITYAVNYFFQYRKWYVMPALKQHLATNQPGTWIDAGCGEGQYIVPLSKKFPQWKCIGMDFKTTNIQFLERLLLHSNTALVQADIESIQGENEADIISSVGVLQYIDDDTKALQNLYRLLKPGGKLVLYLPVNGVIHTAFYKKLLDRYEHYEKVNDRKRIYTSEEVRTKLTTAGFAIGDTVYTYGYLGRISHEITNSLMILITSTNWISRIFASLTLLFAAPFIALLMALDYSRPHSSGNGLLLVAVKPGF